MDKSEFPMRLNKYLAHKGITTRRDADALIEQGKVIVNGKKATLGDKVGETDKVEVKGQKPQKHFYYAYNKPVGVVTNPDEGQKTIAKVLKLKEKVFPVGRLDKESHGLIILSNDGRITDRLLNPDKEHEKEYLVRVDKKINNYFIKRISFGVDIEGYKTKECTAEMVDDHSFSITLSEGKKHQIRRMCTALGFQVMDLERVRIMDVELGKLREGEHRLIDGTELDTFLQQLGLEN